MYTVVEQQWYIQNTIEGNETIKQTYECVAYVWSLDPDEFQSLRKTSLSEDISVVKFS